PLGEQPVRQRALPDADHLQGKPRQQTERSRGPADLDRGVARSAVQPARRRVAGELAHRSALGRQLLFVRGYGVIRLLEAALVAEYRRGEPDIGPDLHDATRDARL